MKKNINNFVLTLAYIYIGLITTYYILSISRISEEYNINVNIVVYCAIPFFVLFFFLRQTTVRELVIFIVMLLMGVISTAITKQATVLLTMTEIICCFNVDIKQVARIMFWIELFFLIFNVVLSLIGVVSNEVIQYQRTFSLFGGLISRNAMGFSHYNGLGLVAFEISTLYILGFNKFRQNYLFNVIGLTLFNLIIYVVSGDRTAFFSFMLLIILISVHRNKRNGKKLCIIADLCLIVFPILCTYGITVLNEKSPNVFNFINNLFQTRPFYILGYINNYGVNLFGNNIKGSLVGLWGNPNQLVNNITLDSGFANLVITYGILFTVVFILVMWSLVNKLEKLRKYNWIIYLIVICFFGLTENVLTFFTYNLCFMMIPTLFMNDKRKYDREI